MLQVVPSILISLIIISSGAAQAQNLIWSTNAGGSLNEMAYSGLQARDGNFLIAGSTFSYGAGEFDIYLLKLDAAGGTIWTKTFGGTSTEYGNDIQAAPDGGYVIVGSTKSFGSGKKDVYLLKMDSMGILQWSKTYGGPEDDEGWSVQATKDSGYIICGTTSSFGAGYGDLYLIKTDIDGDTVWTRTFGGTGGESGTAVKEIPGGGFLAIGSTGSFGVGYSSIYAVRVNAAGDSLWAKTYGGDKADFGYSLAPTLDGGFVIAGSTNSFGAGYSDAYLIKIDTAGQVVWQQTYGGARDDHVYSVCASLDGGLILTGTTESFGAAMLDVYVIKTDPFGNMIWNRNYGGAKSDYGRHIFQSSERDYFIVGYTYSFSPSGTDIYLAKIKGDATPVDDPFGRNLPSGFALNQNYPNPFNLNTIIEYSLPRRASLSITIYNILGQKVKEWQFTNLPAGNHSISWDGTDLRGEVSGSGLYLYRLQADNFAETRKMVLLK